MAKILNFRNKGDAPAGQGFLTDENQTLSFRMNEDGEVSIGDIAKSGLPDLFPDPKKDWSNQELADLFRVRQLLSSANVPVETDRGVTDEGDPWFVFCHANGEVFIHLCRIDGLYVLDSPNVVRPLRGADFNALIADFTNQAIPAQSVEDDAERRVIRLERGGKVRLHPSAMLAALIWTLFLASEELVLLAPEDDETDSDALLDFDGMFAIETTSDTAVDLFFDEDTLDWAQMAKAGGIDADDILHDTPSQMRDAQQQQQGLTAQTNAFSLGLSTIAIAMGFMSETVLLDNQRKVLESLKELGFSEYGSDAQQTAELDIPADAEGNALLAMLADFLGLDLSLNTELADAGNTRQSASELKEDLAHLTGDIGIEDTIANAKVTGAVTIRDKGDDTGLDHASADVELKPGTEDALGSEQGEDTLKAEASQDTILHSLAEALQQWSPTTEIKLGQFTFKSEADLSDEAAFALFDWIDTTTPEQGVNYREFDAVAQRLIEFLEAKDGQIYFLQTSKGVLMVDVTAQTGGETATLHWEAEDGQTISFVGLASDFEQFDMIA
jgi:hypothetical protein